LRPSAFWAIRESTARWHGIVLPLVVTAVILIGWALLSQYGKIPAMFLPSPAGVWHAFQALMADN
jgi:ABC-type nitrate/sulfonate/bicarbonate transport system permease component